jgi:zinc transporter
MNSPQAPGGLVHALLLDGAGGARALAWQEVLDWAPAQGCLWLLFNFEDAETVDWLTQESGLNEIAFSALTSEETRPRCLVRDEQLLLSLRGVNLTPGAAPEDMVSLRVWSDGRKLIGTRRRRLLYTQDLIAELEAGHGPMDAAELLIDWIERIVSRMSETVESYEDQVLALEDAILSGETEGMRSKLAQLRKRTISIRRYLSPQREAMNRLVAESIPWLNEHHRLHLREINDRLIRYIEEIDEVRDRAALSQEELSTRVSEQLNERSYIFTIVATIFLPLGFFTGLMGINVGGMPGVEDAHAFWIVVGLCLGITGLAALLLRLKKWL